jgi:signal transduction histidine kinase
MMALSPADAVVGLAELVRSERDTILRSWKERIETLPVSVGASIATHGARVLDWLAASLAERGRNDNASYDLPLDGSFSAPRAIAELTLLTETIARLKPVAANDFARDSLHRVIDGAIAHSLARDRDEADRLRTRLRLASDVTLVGAWELDPVTGSVTMDARSRELFSVVDDDPPTVEALTSRLHADDRVRVRTGIAQTLGSGQPFLDECRTLRPVAGSLRWIAIAADVHPGVDPRTPSVLGIVHDITASKRTEEEHARVVEELSRAVHISEMFVGILSHDMRNPLGAILGGAQLLGADMRDEKSARVLSLVVSSGERMGRMIDQLLDFTRARLGEGIPLCREPTDLAEVAQQAVAEARAGSAGSVVRLNTTGDTTGTWDGDRLCQILSNLVGNAIVHGSAGGIVDVVVDGTDAASVTLSTRNGGVIPSHLLPVIFNPFRGTLQKRGRSNGLGLGLYVARQIALAHGGELTVESLPAATIFKLVLPRQERGSKPSRQDFVREEELAAFERMAAPSSVSAVTAQLFGATALHERVPLEHSEIVESYRGLLDTALHRKAYRGQGEGLAEDLRVLAERLGRLDAGPREVTDVHARALRQAVRGVTAAKTQALLAEGRLLALELMGNLVSYYRRRSRGPARTSARESDR